MLAVVFCRYRPDARAPRLNPVAENLGNAAAARPDESNEEGNRTGDRRAVAENTGLCRVLSVWTRLPRLKTRAVYSKAFRQATTQYRYPKKKNIP